MGLDGRRGVQAEGVELGTRRLARDAAGEVGFRVIVGGGMGRTPIVGQVIREFLPCAEVLN